VAEGNLEALLRGEMQHPPNLRHNHAILREAHGLSSAIETIALHNFFVCRNGKIMVGCYYDLEPKSILVKDDKFLLTDFGFGHSDSTTLETVPVQGFYYEPEQQTLSTGVSAGKGVDVWAFGCLLFMITTFLQYGPNGIIEFDRSRKTETYVPNHGTFTTKSLHANGQLNPAVQDWFQRIKVDSQSACLSGTVELTQKILVIDPKVRPEISVITEELFFLAHKAVFEFSCDSLLHLLVQMDALPANRPAELVMESERYRIWGHTVGFTKQYADRDRTITRSQEFTSGISNILVDIEDELQYIESWSAHRLGPTYFRLKTLNDKLWAYMSPQLVGEMNRALQSAMLEGKTAEDLENISNTFRGSIPFEYNKIGALAELKHLTIEASTDPDKRDELLLWSSDVSIISDFDAHSLGLVGDGCEPALFEWITYGPHWDEERYLRVPKIARLFSSTTNDERGLRVLRCNGYYQDERKKRFGLIYEIPTLDPRPITLRQLIKNSNKRSDRPSLNSLFELSRKIVQCVLEVHKVGWVHKSVSSYNIIFFPTTASQPIPVTAPYLIGFNHSRGDSRQTFTEGLVDETQRQYHHPEYLQNDHGFRPEHDYYSVGLVLLEIGRWRTMGQLTQPMVGLTLHERSEALVKECADNLRNSMGGLYCDAVMTCLTSDFGGSRNRNEIRDQFETKVVNRLAKLQC